MANKSIGTLTLDLVAKVGGFVGAIDKSERSVKGFRRNVEKHSKAASAAIFGITKAFLGVATIGGAALTALGLKSIKLASDMEETQGKFSVVFRGMNKEAEGFSKELQDNFFLSEVASKQFLSSIQDTLVPMGLAREEAGRLSFEVVKLAADLGSFNNLPTEIVIRDLQSALVGNTETVKKYGIVLRATDIQQRALVETGKQNVKELTNAEKVQAAYNIILEGSADSIGDMARTSESLANQQKRLQANIQDLTTTLGNKLLPKATEIVTSTNDWIDANEDLIDTKLDEFIATVVNHKGDLKELLETGINGMRLLATAGLGAAAAIELTSKAIANELAPKIAFFNEATKGLTLSDQIIPGAALFKIIKNFEESSEIASSVSKEAGEDIDATYDKYERFFKLLSGESDFQLPVNTPTKQVKKELEELTTATEEASEAQENLAKNTKESLEAAKKQAEDNKKTMAQFGATFTSAFEEAILGGEKFSDILKGLEEDLIRIALRRYVLEPLFNGIFGGGGIGSLFGGGTSIVGSASGNVFAGGNVVPFKTGGIINSMVGFPMSGGKIGVAGEAGTEAILPVKRNKNGDLGIAAKLEAVGNGTVINIHTPPGSNVSQEQSQDGGVETIDIFIDQAVANKINDPRSKTSRSLKNTFGLGQQLTKR